MLNYESQLENFQEIGENFATASLKVLYLGKNPNGSYFSKESVEKNIHSLKNMPIVGEFSNELKDFKGHGGEIVVEDEKIYLRPTTRPYGVVPESFSYEWIMDDVGDGRQKETLVVHGVILWTKHYEEASNILFDKMSQSMEIKIDDGNWNEEYEVFEVTDFSFYALCVLGENVNPAFSNSHFYSEMNEFKAEFTLMMNELNSEISQKEDKHLMDNKDLELFKKKKDEEEKAKEKKDLEDKKKDENPSKVDPKKKEKDLEKDKQADPKEKKTDIPEKDKDKENDPVEKSKELDPEKLKSEIDDLKTKLKEKEEELKKLRSFQQGVLQAQHEAQFESLMAKYNLVEADIELDDIFEFSLEQLEEKMLMAVGRKAVNGNFSLETIAEELPKNKVDLTKTTNVKSDPYGGLFQTFSK